MPIQDIPELQYLLRKVEERYGRKISTSKDFESLSTVIEWETGEIISASTLKRLWGYVSLNPTPRLSTLNILSHFVGQCDFRAFCNDLKRTGVFDSTFFTTQYLDVASLQGGRR